MTPEAGQRFGPYEILSRLGGGAMGLVFRAWDARLHREVAIKLLHDDYEMPGMRERFLQEARAASALNHPHICTIFDIGEQDGEPYLVMELLEGETLKERISRGALPADEIVRYGQEVADALSAAHAKGIVHRDIKPANIFLVDKPNGRPQAKVLDFGLAKIGLTMTGGRASRTLDLTLAGATVGTLSYMSPEQARGLSLDERSDLFSLGVVMYEMATRHVPFQGATSALIFVQLLNHAPEPPHEWNESIPRELEKVIMKLLHKERDGRYQTANELSEGLRRIPFKTGGWLKKAVVPLVRAEDPVARVKRPVRPNSEVNRPVAPPPLPDRPRSNVPDRAKSSGDNMLIRPVSRMPQKDSAIRGGLVPADHPVEPKDNNGAVVAAGSPSGSTPEIRSAATTSSADIEDVAIPARSRSGVTQFEFEVEDLVEKPETSPTEVTPLQSTGAALDPASKDDARPAWGGGWRMAAGTVLLTAIVGSIIFLVNSGRFRPVLLRQGEPVLLTMIQNRTDDKSLDGAVMQGLELALQQSQYLTVRGGDAYRAAVRQSEGDSGGATASGRRLAQMVGAKAYLYGELRGNGAPYTISLDVLNTESNDKLTSIEETADSKEQLAAAIDRLAVKLRGNLGESDRAISKSSVSLEHEGTAQVSALSAFAVGEAARQSGRIEDAIAAYQKAIGIDPKFSGAHVQLSWLYEADKAEVAAGREAGLGAAATDAGSDRLKLLAQFADAMNRSGDFVRATGILRQFKELYAQDVAEPIGMARLLRVEGHLPEALQAAQQAYTQDPYGADAYVEAEADMIGMDRAQGALQLEEQAVKLGVVRGWSTLAAAYLAGDDAVLKRQIALAAKAIGSDGVIAPFSYGSLSKYGLYLDNEGHLAAGGELWLLAGSAAGRSTELQSTESSMLAIAALDRALANDCGLVPGFTKAIGNLPMGEVATFNAGIADALCGDKSEAERAVASLKQSYIDSSAVKGYYIADLQAAMALAAKDPKQALSALSTAEAYDQISLTPYLRGLAHLSDGEASLAIADFQTILDHRGAAFLAGSNVYPMAQIGLARAYAAIGDELNSTAAYRRYLELWHDSEHGQPNAIHVRPAGR